MITDNSNVIPCFQFSQSDTLLNLLGGGDLVPEQPNPAPAPPQPSTVGGDLLDLLGGLDLGPTNAGIEV